MNWTEKTRDSFRNSKTVFIPTRGHPICEVCRLIELQGLAGIL
jgi:hypothetical protein